jgi:serine/threonine-protein kinase
VTDPIAGLNLALSDRYVIDRELGRGGMAIVYLARDLKHERFVALKTLRPEIAVALGRDRFLREIKLAARLQHPNILAVYDSGDAAGVLYYVMPYVEGESLRERLDREPQLPLDEALQIAREVADALAYAHGHDVVHRDIKPENIMLSGGHAIVADFGIARAVSAAGGDKLTETGLAIGTPAYMSPEQAAGTGQVDRRSDIYSLACVLYETLAGQPPFTGPTAQAIMARHSLDSVPRLRIVRETIPDALEDVIKRALAKVPADRHQTAAQFAEALAAASTGRVSPVTARPRLAARALLPRHRLALAGAGVLLLAGAAWMAFGRRGNPRPTAGGELDPRRVAVLYFADRSPDSSLGYLADGLTETLIDELSPVRSLDVISRNGVAPFRHSDLPRDSIARTLQAGTLVEGSVEPVGPRIRVTIRLVDGASGADVRRESFELPSGEVLAIRDSLARRAALVLREGLGEEVRLREQRAGTRSVDAWTLVQRAEKARKDAEDLLVADRAGAALASFRLADSLLAAAEQADVRWVEPMLARGRIAYRLARLSIRQPVEARGYIDQGLGHITRALARAPNDAAALEFSGTLRYARWLFLRPTDAAEAHALLAAAQRDLEQAVEHDPSLAGAFSTLSHLRYQTKDVVGAVLAARRAYEEDAYLAVAPDILWRLFLGSYDLAQFAQARRWCDEGYRRFPRNFRFTECQLWIMTTSATPPDVEGAWRLLSHLEPLVPAAQREYQLHRAQLVVGGVIGLAGLTDSARRVLKRARADERIDPEQELLFTEAFMRTLMGDRDEAIQLLKRGVAARPEHAFRQGGDVHWWWRDLQNHPGFRGLLGSNH